MGKPAVQREASRARRDACVLRQECAVRPLECREADQDVLPDSATAHGFDVDMALVHELVADAGWDSLSPSRGRTGQERGAWQCHVWGQDPPF